MPTLAAMLACVVIGVADGDTLTARCDTIDGRVNITVRVAEIDAPERLQPRGNRSRQHLAALCHGKPAIVSPRTTDRYGRTVARVECDGIDASAQQVRAGMAWVFDRYRQRPRAVHGAGRSACGAARTMGRRAAGGAVAVAEGRATAHAPRAVTVKGGRAAVGT